MQFIDTHIHLQDYKAKDTPQILQEAALNGVEQLVAVSASLSDWDRVAAFTEFGVIPAFGLHPWYINTAKPDWSEQLKAKLILYPQALIGECGLDGYHRNIVNLDLQYDVFASHLNLALELNRPLSIHLLKAWNLFMEFVPQLRNLKFALHSFGGSVEIMQQMEKIGAYISFSPSVVRRSNFSDLARAVRLEHLLLETDGPHQGDFADLNSTLKLVAHHKNIDSEELKAIIYQNAKEFINVR